MNFFKKTLYATLAASLLSCPLSAKAMKTPEPASVETAAMAGMDVVVNSDFELLTNPALMEYRGTKFSVLGLNLKVNDLIGALDAVNGYKTFFTGLESVSDERKLDYVSEFVRSSERRSVDIGISLMPSLQLSTSVGTFAIAGYAADESCVVANPKGFQGLVNLSDAIEGADVQSFLGGREFVIDKPLQIFSVSDLGASVGYAKGFSISNIVEVSAGVNVRVFERVMVDYAPSSKISVKVDQSDLDAIAGGEDVKSVLMEKASGLENMFGSVPELVTGVGFALDFGLVLSKRFWVMDAMLGASLRNAPANSISYSNGTSAMDGLQYDAGLSLRPMSTFPVFKGLLVGAEMHGVEGLQTYHMGLSWKFGNDLSVTPKVGFQVGKINALGNFSDVNIFTTGFSVDLKAMKLAASYGLGTDGRSQFGFGLDFGYEWGK